VQAPPGSSTIEQLPSSAQQAPLLAGGVKSISSCGRRLASAFSRLSKRFVLRESTSFPMRIHPKLLAGASSQPWASVAICALDQV
jgi:hypothetical protein